MASKAQLRALRQKFHLGEFSKKHKRKAIRVSRPKRVKHRRVLSMVRRGRIRRFVRRQSRSVGGIGNISGLAKSGLIGIGAAHVAGYIPINVPYKEEAAGALAGYMLGGKNIKGAIVGAGAVFLAKMANGQGVSGSGTNAYGF